MCAIVTRSLPRVRPTVIASKARSGCATVTASRRTHAARRCFADTLENDTASRTFALTPGTVPVSRRPSGRSTRTVSDSDDPVDGANVWAAAVILSTVGVTSCEHAFAEHARWK